MDKVYYGTFDNRSDAIAHAKALGLQHRGFGRWYLPDRSGYFTLDHYATYGWAFDYRDSK